MNKKLKGKIVEEFGSQFQFARALNEHEATVSRVIRGRVVLDSDAKEKWANILKCSTEIFEG